MTEPAGTRGGSAVEPLRWLLAAAIVLPLLGALTGSWLAWRNHLGDANRRLLHTIALVHEHADKVFETHKLIGDVTDLILDGRDSQGIRRDEGMLQGRLQDLRIGYPQVSDIWVLDERGQVLVSARIKPMPGTSYADRPFFKAHRDDEGAGAFVTELANDRPLEDVFAISHRRAAPSGAFAGVTLVFVDAAYFRDFYALLETRGSYAASLVRADGRVLARYPEPPQRGPELAPTGAFATAIRRSPQSGVFTTVSELDGVERIVAYSRLRDLPIYATAALAIRDIRADWRDRMLTYAGIALPANAALIGIIVVAMRRTRRESEALARLRAEVTRREASESRLRQSQKMEAVGQLTGGIAHDFNNMLTVVIGNLGVARRRLAAGETARAETSLAAAAEGATRAASLTHRLLAFARRQPLAPQVLEPGAVIASMTDLLRHSLGETIALEIRQPGEVWCIRADRNQLENALLNLAVNARDAMSAGGRLVVETRNLAVTDAATAAREALPVGDWVCIDVTDTGTGMPSHVIERAFDPFFTTKPLGEGTGLGLSMVYGLVQQSGGQVRIDSEPGQGTRVTMCFPRHVGEATAQSAQPAPPRAPPVAQPPPGAHVLLVEDEEPVRRYAAEALREMQLDVIEAGSGEEALSILDRGTPVDLLFTDLVLPGLTGQALAEAARQRRPDLRVLFTTGYSRDLDDEESVTLLRKPFTLDELRDKIAEAMRAASDPATTKAGP